MLNPTLAEAVAPFAPAGSSSVSSAREFAVRRVTRNSGLRLKLPVESIHAAERAAVERLRCGASVFRAADASIRERLPRRGHGSDPAPREVQP